MMHFVDDERLDLAAYRLKSVSSNLLDHWKEGKDKDVPHPNWVYFEQAFLGHFFPQELREAKVHKFLTLKYDILSFHEYCLKFT